MRRDFKKFYEKFRSWMFDAALPLWGGNGVDNRGGFRERLALDGSVIVDDMTRVRVQGRQTYCFAQAYNLGWMKGRALALMGVEALRQKARLPNGLPGTVILPGKGLSTDQINLYDIAFYLFALGETKIHINYDCLDKDITSLIALLQDIVQRPTMEGGYKETIPTIPLREQNPHMHLLEAILSIHQGTNNPQTKSIAVDIVKFVITTFFDVADGALHELSLYDNRPDEDRYEAGHQFEWVWLLHRVQAFKIMPTQKILYRLSQKGKSLTNANGWIPLSHTLSGEIRQNIYRSWVQAEALKAFLILYEKGDVSALGHATRAGRILLDHHLLDNGGWIDQYDNKNIPLSSDMPASTFYHAMRAFSEVARINAIL